MLSCDPTPQPSSRHPLGPSGRIHGYFRKIKGQRRKSKGSQGPENQQRGDTEVFTPL